MAFYGEKIANLVELNLPRIGKILKSQNEQLSFIKMFQKAVELRAIRRSHQPMLPQFRVDFGVEYQRTMTSLVLAEVILKDRHHSRDGLTDDVDELEVRKESFQGLWNLVDDG